MIRLGARLAVSGGRESVVRLLLTVVGVAVGTALLLLAAAADPAIRARQDREAWQFTTGDPEGAEDSGDALRWLLDRDHVDGEQMEVLRVAAEGPGAPVPLGLGHVPRPGEVYVSPALAQLLDELPADRLGDRFPAGPTGLVPDRFLAGPDHLVAVVGTELGQLDERGVHRVHTIRTEPEPFQFTDGLRVLSAIGAVGLLMPVTVFVSTSTRLGAARREQRFAALRLAGATPRQTNLVAAVEAGATAAIGAGLGALGYELLRPQAAGIEIDGHVSFLSDVRVAPALLVAILVAVPVLSMVAAMVSLRRLQISPLGVARRSVRARPTARRLVPFVVGSVCFAVSLGIAMGGGGGIGSIIPLMVSFAVMIYGIVAAGPWLTVLTARAIGRLGRRASALLAGRRLEDDPASGFRAVSGLVLAVFVASVFSGVTPALLAEDSAHEEGTESDTMVAGFPDGTSGADAEAALAAATSAGGERGVILYEDPDPERPLEDPAAGRGPTTVVTCEGAAVLDLQGECPAGGTGWYDEHNELVEPAPYSLTEVVAMPVRMLAIEADGPAATTDRIRTAIQRAVPRATPWLESESRAVANNRLTQLNRLANLALVLTLMIAGCSLAVAVAGGIIERQRPFALLRLSGMHLAELRRVALLEAAAPLLLIAFASALAGLATSAVIVTVAGGIPWKAPSIGYWGSLAGGMVVALAVTAATLPVLGRATAPSAVRFE